MAEIKTDEKRIGASDQDPMVDVTCVIHNARDMASSWWWIEDPTTTT